MGTDPPEPPLPGPDTKDMPNCSRCQGLRLGNIEEHNINIWEGLDQNGRRAASSTLSFNTRFPSLIVHDIGPSAGMKQPPKVLFGKVYQALAVYALH